MALSWQVRQDLSTFSLKRGASNRARHDYEGRWGFTSPSTRSRALTIFWFFDVGRQGHGRGWATSLTLSTLIADKS